jgi:hypothetical protein
MTDNSKRTGAAIEAHYQFLAWLVPTIEKFPKSHKFTIGDRIQSREILICFLSLANPSPGKCRGFCF